MAHLLISLKNNFPIKINTVIDKKPKIIFKGIEKDSNYTVKCFLDAIASDQVEDAEVYISKNYVDKIDVIGIKDMFEDKDKKTLPLLIKAKISNVPKNCKMDTLLVWDKYSEKNKLIHIYMLHEPDIFAKWKIYSIEEESI